MANSRLQNARRNIIWLTINRILSLFLPFLTRTCIIYYLGALYLGLNGLFSTILTMLSLAELGFGSAMVFSMYEPLARGNDDDICALLNLYRKIYRSIGFFILIMGLGLIPFLHLLIKGDIPQGTDVVVLYLIYLFGTVISYFLYAYKESLLIADQRTDVTSNVQSVVNVCSTIIQLILLYITRNYYFFCLVLPLSSIIRNLIINKIVTERYPNYKCHGALRKEIKDDIRKRVTGLFIYKICYVFRDSIANLFVSAFLGLSTLGIYTNYFYITTSITGFFTVIKSSITASIGNSIVSESQEKNYRDFNKCQLLYMSLSSWASICLLCLIQPFMRLWLGNDFLFPELTMIFFCFYFYCYKMGDVCAVYRQAAGLWWQDRYRPVVEALTNIILCFYLVGKIGVLGVLSSSIFCLVCINSVWASWVLYRYYFTDYKQIDYFIKLGYYTFLTLFVGCVAYLICSFFNLSLWLDFLARAIVCFSIVPMLLIYGIKSHPEYNNCKKLLVQLVSHRK